MRCHPGLPVMVSDHLRCLYLEVALLLLMGKYFQGVCYLILIHLGGVLGYQVRLEREFGVD